ncbi:MAG: hypothetical protein ACOX2R_00545 [Anaerolineae bacterium]|jgi:hypothetical protein
MNEYQQAMCKRAFERLADWHYSESERDWAHAYLRAHAPRGVDYNEWVALGVRVAIATAEDAEYEAWAAKHPDGCQGTPFHLPID